MTYEMDSLINAALLEHIPTAALLTIDPSRHITAGTCLDGGHGNRSRCIRQYFYKCEYKRA